MALSDITLLVFACLLISDTVRTDPDSVTTDTPSETQGTNGTQAGIRPWFCEKDWIPYEDDHEISCLWPERTAQNFASALSRCQQLGGSLVTMINPDKEGFIKALSRRGESGDFWIGLSKDRGYSAVFQWHSRKGLIPATGDNLPQQLKQVIEYQTYKAQCAYIPAYGDDLEVEDCESEYLSICEKDIECVSGTFGSKCERECHCAGEPCDPAAINSRVGVTCKWGCQINWMGVACDKEKQDPDVKYFCINSPEENGRYVYIRINTKGVQYRAIYGLTANKDRGNWCDSTIVDSSDSQHALTTIKIPVNNVTVQEMSGGRCVGQQVNENTFSWNLIVKENDGILLEHDLVVTITCDFSAAEKLTRSDHYNIQGSDSEHVHHATFSPESIQDDVKLLVASAYSGQPISQAVIGSTVVLQMKYNTRIGSLQGVAPHSCVATSSDGKLVKELLDHDGCQVPGSPLQPFTLSGNDSISTPWFNLFAFENEQTVTFQCSFNLCFTPICQVGCQQRFQRLRRKRDANEKTELSTTRTVRVLPSIPAQKPSGPKQLTADSEEQQYYSPPRPRPAPAAYDPGPFIYLNPVTCTMFLLILLIFLCMYIYFLRTLRKSVYDIRKEVEVKRSRDKFLHCGCVQQKDRDYVSPGP